MAETTTQAQGRGDGAGGTCAGHARHNLAGTHLECGLPAGVDQVAPGYGETGAALIDAVDFIMFRGALLDAERLASPLSGPTWRRRSNVRPPKALMVVR